MTLSIIIPAHNEEKYLPACLQSIVEHRSASVIEIIVVDNASTDGTTEVAARFPGVRAVREERKGLTFARQRGFLEARGELIANVDADTRVSRHWFEILERRFAEHPGLIGLSGPYDYYDLSAWKRFFVGLYWTFLAVPAWWITGAVMVGGNFVVRRDALERIGGFDTSIAFYGEDADLARRLHTIGPVRFDCRFVIQSSGRRLQSEGIIRTTWTYIVNYLSEIFLKRPVTKGYTDVR